MSLFGRIDDFYKRRRAGSNRDSDKMIELPPFDEQELLEDLHAGALIREPSSLQSAAIFGKYSEDQVRDLMEQSGILPEIRRKGYETCQIELQYLSELDQRIFVRYGSEVLLHLRLKLAHFRFRLNAGAPSRKLLYIDWLMTRHPLSTRIRPDRLFPGQDLPGLGIFPQVSTFIFDLACGIGAKGAFNIPEYFHDALLFHRQFRFYDPGREAFFLALIRDLRGFGVRKISMALAAGRITDRDGSEVRWVPAEMIRLVDSELAGTVWSKDYFTKVVRNLKRLKFTLSP